MPSEQINLSDSDDFLEATRRGDARAWEIIFGEYRGYLFTVAQKCLEPCSDDVCFSVVQDSLGKSFERIDQFRGHTRKELRVWLGQIVANEARDRKRARGHESIPLGSDGEELVPGSESTPSAKAARREQAAGVLAAMEKTSSRLSASRRTAGLSKLGL
jgi:DNA-directed RNA polymerase specialized sigma24 family protein